MRKKLLVFCVLSATGMQVLAAEATRFSGSASLRSSAARSADGRYRIDAELRAEPAMQADGRFALTAKLQPSSAQVLVTACGAPGTIVFQNGFEN